MSLILLGILNSQAAGAAAAGAYDLLETQVLGTAAASVTFTGLGSYTDYKHLQIRSVSRQADSSDYRSLQVRFNGDTGSNYAFHYLSGDGSSVTSSAGTATTSMQVGVSVGTATADNYGPSVIDILDFSNSSKNTTIRGLFGTAGSASSQVRLASGLWDSTAAVTSITLSNYNAPTKDIVAGSRFSLYGVK